MKALLTIVFVFMLTTPAWGQQQQVPRNPAAGNLPSALTLGLRAGVNLPVSELSVGFLPDVDLGYRHNLNGFAIEPAFGWQTWRGNASGVVPSDQIVNGDGEFVQRVSANVWEGRLRGWYDLGDSGALLGALHLGVVDASTRQESFGQVWEEAESNLTFAVFAGYAYPLPEAYGSVQVLVGYRHAPVDFLTTGSANISGVQALLGWQVAYPF